MNEVTLKLNEEDVWPLLMSAFRYSLGRRTYMPSLIVGILKDNSDKLTEYQRKQIAREIYEFKEAYGEIGEWFDTAMWLRFAQEMES